jgi:hypothetical protein
VAKPPTAAEIAQINATVVALVTGHRGGLTPAQFGELLHEQTRPLVRVDVDNETVYLDSLRARDLIIAVLTAMLADLFDQFEAVAGTDVGGDILKLLGESAASERA